MLLRSRLVGWRHFWRNPGDARGILYGHRGHVYRGSSEPPGLFIELPVALHGIDQAVLWPDPLAAGQPRSVIAVIQRGSGGRPPTCRPGQGKELAFLYPLALFCSLPG